MSEKWYHAEHYYSPSIKEVLVEKYTDASVFIDGTRRKRDAESSGFYKTWQEAHARLMTWAERNVDQARRQLEWANAKLGNVKGMKP